jgi:hypothetical protein
MMRGGIARRMDNGREKEFKHITIGRLGDMNL